MADEHAPAELREHLDDLLKEEADLQRLFGVPDLDAASAAWIEDGDHAAVNDQLDSLSRLRTVRHEIELVYRAVSRSDARRHDVSDLGVSA